VPFLVALAIITLVVIGIFVMNRAGGTENTDREAVVRAAIGQNDALQRLNYADYRANTCAEQAGVEADMLAHQQKSATDRGARFVENVTNVSVNGDRATATVKYFFDHDRNAKIDVDASFVREDGSWRVCTATPS